ncbi:MAG: glycosyltransferase family A protein [Mangrovibacterium sp.]
MISVIIPTYNRRAALYRAVESVVNQSYKVDEIIIVDDYSINMPLLEDFKNLAFQNISLYSNENPSGANFSRNFGVSKATGDIVMFLDDDDTWEKDKVKNQMAIFDSDSEIGLVYSSKVVVNDKDRDTDLRYIRNTLGGDLSKKIFKRNWIGSTSCAAVRKNVFNQVGGFDVEMPSMQDYDLWIRLCQVTKVGCDENIGLRYTIYDDVSKQMTGQYERHERTVLRFKEKYADVPTRLRRALLSNICFSCAKSIAKARNMRFLKYAMKSFVYKPNLRVFGILFVVR